MDIQAAKPNKKTIVLLHGKNFNGYYWKTIIPFLTAAGFRVIIPDQIGWGRSDKPDIHYSFHMLALNTANLLDTLHISRVTVLGHSMGGMLAVRFSLLYPHRVEKLILEDPIGLEDYKTFVPYRSLEEVYQQERQATYASYKKYQQDYYPEWKPEYEQYVQSQAEVLGRPDFDKIAWANALTYEMIYQQPVLYEFENIKVPVLLLVGQSDRTIVGKEQLADSVKSQHGNYPELGRKAKERIQNARLIELPGMGHIPHIQDTALFEQAISSFLMDQIEEF
ncbi:MAG: alpha/beta hydrolase [Bacteroidota bacterium]